MPIPNDIKSIFKKNALTANERKALNAAIRTINQLQELTIQLESEGHRGSDINTTYVIHGMKNIKDNMGKQMALVLIERIIRGIKDGDVD